MVYLDAETERQRKCQDDEDPRHDDQGETATGALSRCIVYYTRARISYTDRDTCQRD